jgi:Skp family chaperone for outer membrane proteins
MIRRFIAVASAALFVGSVAAQDAKLKIATVDMQQLFKEYYKTNEAQQQINVERARIQKDNNEKLTAIRQIETDMGALKTQTEDPSLSDQKKAQAYKDHQAKYQEGIQLDKERREYLSRKNQALNEKMVQRMRGILEEIRKLVEERAKSENFDYVFDKSGMSTSQVPFLLYTKDATDITATLLKDLNKDAPADAVPAQTPAPETPETPAPDGDTTPGPAPGPAPIKPAPAPKSGTPKAK